DHGDDDGEGWMGIRSSDWADAELLFRHMTADLVPQQQQQHHHHHHHHQDQVSPSPTLRSSYSPLLHAVRTELYACEGGTTTTSSSSVSYVPDMADRTFV